jgi:penicillin-binding protein 2
MVKTVKIVRMIKLIKLGGRGCQALLPLLLIIALFGLFGYEGKSDAELEHEMDIALYKAAKRGLGKVKGAVIVTDPRTGRIRAVVKRDASILKPYPPGSLVKLVTVWAGLERGHITPDAIYKCKGTTTLSNRNLTCWLRKGHGRLNLVKAISNSCNIYFYNLAEEIGSNPTYKGLKALGFGEVTGIDLVGADYLDGVEIAGTLLPPDAPYLHDYVIGDTDNITASPLQVITYLSALVNGGNIFLPGIISTITKATDTTKGEISAFTPKVICHINVSRSESIIKQGMFESVKFGTGRRARVDELNDMEIIGKTGTGGFIGAEKATHGWFLGFAPKERPEIGVLVFIYRGTGGEDAAPVAGEIFKTYFGIDSDDSEDREN